MREQLTHAQEGALGALGLPTAADVATLERRLRAPAEALNRIEEQLDRIETRIRRLEAAATADPSAHQPPRGQPLDPSPSDQ